MNKKRQTQPTESFSFTLKSTEGKYRELLTNIGISLPFDASDEIAIEDRDERIHSTIALWDTGATNSVVTSATAKALGLKPITKVISNHAGGQSEVNVYLVHIFLPNKIIIPNVKVTECNDLTGKFGILVGMDIITAGDFSVTNLGGSTVFSFRIPSLHTVDYNDSDSYNDALPIKLKPTRVQPRNERCDCGSGKKFKHCHGK